MGIRVEPEARVAVFVVEEGHHELLQPYGLRVVEGGYSRTRQELGDVAADVRGQDFTNNNNPHGTILYYFSSQ